ncbi:Fic family protein [Pengzhenrongella sp.]|jgi:Fic family protein|uniref:Fic family protein n=1 Tax=Pengzhenrongella sp. TaxID=2888820 RepID=UPI002F95BDB1
MASLGDFLLRTESVASSRIERVDATMDNLAKAVVGIKAPPEAHSMIAATRALTAMVTAAGDKGRIELDDILDAHRRLMHEDPVDGQYAGNLRTMQNWIGGSNYSPRDAVHVPPSPEMVPDLMTDLVRFVNRRDMPALTQAAIAHAQFESIHAFTDGNGRIGRALINAVLRRRGVTSRAIIPVASVMVADVDRYFSLVNAYRDGAAGPFVSYLANATLRASQEARVSAVELAAMPARWHERVHARRGSAAAKLIDVLLEHPALDAQTAALLTGASTSSTYTAIEQLAAADVLHPITQSKRNLAWAATDVMDEIESLNARLRTPPK